ncbi:EAL domain-containing protein [Proteiniclasticum sp. BAD-10]|uniref:EAL domain-containing protein n=1 Tax=Proteiniclasticum sediminis TaxID=2804028 RepID=A0A941CP09_9CLOT|nr:GGDEF domain-containing phosphodiesterase [Proteiniclasticum sediminis]MBR0575183.1 EAL domain-containing protein [Proteiniclasticum sediminis]
MTRKRIKTVELRIFLIPLLLALIIVALVGGVLANIQVRAYKEHRKEDALRYANTYSYSVTKALEAQQAMKTLMEEKMMAAGEMAGSMTSYTDEGLSRLADLLDIDVIYQYSAEGIIEHTSDGRYRGWTAKPGHPVYTFMTGDQDRMVEEIRQDTESKEYFQYMYFRRPDGIFLQLGIRAEKVRDQLNEFELQQILEEMKAGGAKDEFSLLNAEGLILGSTVPDRIGARIEDPAVLAAMDQNESFNQLLEYGDQPMYLTYIPLYVKGEKYGTLGILQDMKDLNAIYRDTRIYGAVALVAVLMSFLAVLFFTYRRNAKQLRPVYYDSLTGLPNQAYLKETLALSSPGISGKRALLLINCSNLKTINLSYGFDYANEALKYQAGKLARDLSGKGELFQFTPDKFVFVVDGYHDSEVLKDLARRVTKSFHQEDQKDGEHQFIKPEIGIAELSGRDWTSDELLTNAALALSHVDPFGAENFAFFTEEMQKSIAREDLLEREIREDLQHPEKNLIYMEYMPMIQVKTGRILAFEALARMSSNYFGAVSPVEFIDIAEKKQLIVPLGYHILRKVCQFVKKLQNEGFPELRVSFNISALQLFREDFVSTVLDILRECGVKPQSLSMEITESVLMENLRELTGKLKILREAGIHIVIDDFGTGYSSFYQLHELPIDALKIDRYFIKRITYTHEQEILTGDIISMAHRLGYRVVAEGVEDEIQYTYIRDKGCDVLQGHLFSQALHEDVALERIKRTLIFQPHDGDQP